MDGTSEVDRKRPSTGGTRQWDRRKVGRCVRRKEKLMGQVNEVRQKDELKDGHNRVTVKLLLKK